MSEGRRRRRARAVAAAAFALTLAGCWGRPAPELLRRHVAYEVADTADVVRVTVFSVPAGESVSATPLTALSASAQSAMIRSVADKTSTPEAFLRTLGPPVSGAGGRDAAVDLTRFRRRVVVSAENRAARPSPDPDGGWRAHPAARISRLRVAVGADPRRARFLSWDRFASRHETVDLGEMTFRRERGASRGLDLDPGAALRELDPLGLDLSRRGTLGEELPLSRRYVSTGVLLPDSMILLQEGAVGVDLTGNAVLEVVIDVEDAPTPARSTRFAGLFAEDGSARPPDSVRVVGRDLVHAGRAEDLRASLRVDAVVRDVRRGAGDATWAEGDDHVRYLVQSSAGPESVLIPAAELRTSVWQLATRGCGAFLHLDADGTGRPAVVQLASAAEAFSLLRWLRELRPSEVGGRGLLLGPDRPLEPAIVDDLSVRLHPLNWRPPSGASCP